MAAGLKEGVPKTVRTWTLYGQSAPKNEKGIILRHTEKGKKWKTMQRNWQRKMKIEAIYVHSSAIFKVINKSFFRNKEFRIRVSIWIQLSVKGDEQLCAQRAVRTQFTTREHEGTGKTFLRNTQKTDHTYEKKIRQCTKVWSNKDWDLWTFW